jgi:PII-like signaling protein
MEIKSVKRMTIYLTENQQFEHRAAYEVLLELFRDAGIESALKTKGIAGFGTHRKIHTDRIELLAYDLPVIVEASRSLKKIDRVLPRAAQVAGERVIEITPVGCILPSGRGA